MAEEVVRRVTEVAIPIISDVQGFRAYYVVYAPGETVRAMRVFTAYAADAGSVRCAVAWMEQNLMPLLGKPCAGTAGTVIVHALAKREGSAAVSRIRTRRGLQHGPRAALAK